MWRGCDNCLVSGNTIAGANRCVEAIDSSGDTIQSNLLGGCWGAYVNIVGNTPGLAVSNNVCDRAADNCDGVNAALFVQ